MPFERNASAEEILSAIEALPLESACLMEVCGTHTVAIARSGLKQMLPSHIKLLSGPGCPVCVTPSSDIDEILDLTTRPNVTIATYGDMLRVPGSQHGDSLRRRGGSVKMVYSALDAVDLAQKHPEREVVFLGVGFETTAPGTAIAVEEAKRRGVTNFSIVPLLKTVEPALRALIADPDFAVQGFLCPGHVAAITGAEAFDFLPREFSLPAVVSGFEPMDILLSVYHLLKQLAENQPMLENEYDRVVPYQGNRLAMAAVARCFTPCDAVWRGMGIIPQSGLTLREEYAAFDAVKKFSLHMGQTEKQTACRCGEVITGKRRAEDCPLFGTVCLPENPVGPCMVSGEGACSAAYQYRTI